MADIFCDEDVEEYVQKDCGIDNAGIVAVAFIDPDAYDDDDIPTDEELSDTAWWTALLEASPKQVHIATKTRGESQGASVTEEEGFGKSATQITGANRETPVEFEGLEENRGFVEGINRRKWRYAFVTSGGKLGYVHTRVTPFFSERVPKSTTTGAFWGGTVKWQDFSNPRFVEAPADIFDE